MLPFDGNISLSDILGHGAADEAHRWAGSAALAVIVTAPAVTKEAIEAKRITIVWTLYNGPLECSILLLLNVGSFLLSNRPYISLDDMSADRQ
jgi:hypothetical protein